MTDGLAQPELVAASNRSGRGYLFVVIEIPIMKLDESINVPEYATLGDAGVDLRAAAASTVLAGGGRALVPTGVAVAIPDGYAGFIQPRSGLALKYGVTVLNSPGLIDSGYRGELKVLLINHDTKLDFVVERGDRIAQLVIQRCESVRFVETTQLIESARGVGGFGSTGSR